MAVKKGAIGEIISRFEKAGFKLVAARFMKLSDDLLDTWYAHHKDKPFFPGLKAFMTATPVMAMLWEGENAVLRVRKLCGPTDSRKALKGTIRADFGEDVQQNAIHCFGKPGLCRTEKKLIFQPHEICEY